MNRRRSSFRLPAAPAWRLALTLGLACAWAAPQAASAQTGPQATSPGVPFPYQSSNFHAGGAPGVPPAAAVPYTNTPAQLQGTPTEYVTLGGLLVPTQIPSFLLGNYDPTSPPSAAGAYYRSHLADGGVYSWAAPFAYLPASTGTVTVDDSLIVAAGGNVFVPVNFTSVATGPAAGTAAGGSYSRLAPDTGTPPSAANSTVGSATWTLTATAAGSFSVYFHISDNIGDAAGVVEPRSTAVVYTVAVSGSSTQTVRATASQTEANSLQYLAGPFQLAVGDIVTVTLQRDTTKSLVKNGGDAKYNQGLGADYLIADSMTLQATIGDVRSTPTAINYESYPADFARAKYWGIYIPTGAGAVPAGGTQAVSPTSIVQNALPDYGSAANTNPPAGPPAAGAKPYLRLGDPVGTQPDGTAVDGPHRIRQLVYFGRSEPITNHSIRVDDNDGTPAFTTTGTPAWNTVAFSAGPPVVNTNATTATNSEYQEHLPAVGAPTATATWAFTAPASASYFLSVHLPQVNAATETRITDANYHVSVNGTDINSGVGFTISQQPAGTGAGDVVLATGALNLLKGDTVAVVLGNATTNPIIAAGAVTEVIADSVTLATGNGQGAIYCVDGFTGGVVWRFQTPASPRNGPSAPVYSSPAIARVNVMVTPGDPNAAPVVPPTYANKLVTVVGDDNGMVYCLDAIGNGDGTSNANALDANGQPIYTGQPAYGTTAAPFDATKPHVGTTSVYWVYRPDRALPKNVHVDAAATPPVAAADIGKVKTTPDPNSDLPVPGPFGLASPTVFVDPSKTTTPTTAADSNATVFVGNGNGVLYALDAAGTAYTLTNDPTSTTYPYGDTFNVALPLTGLGVAVPTCQPLWWFTLRGGSPNSGAVATSADIESAPALSVTYTPPVPPATVGTYTPTVYVGSAHEQQGTSNVGRLYALNGLYGPSGNSGKSAPLTQPNPTAANYTGPGSASYNVAQRPQISPTDKADWSFPDAYGTDTYTTGLSSDKKPRPALGNLTGSPVVFTNVAGKPTDPTNTNIHEKTAASQTRIYFAANSGLEVPVGATVTKAPTVRPDETMTGRVWAVNLDGSVGTTTNTSGAGAHAWAYPLANDPNDATKDKIAEPFAPIGAFLHVTPAIGYVQFPARIDTGAGAAYVASDQVATGGLLGQSVPMLYVATRGVDDTSLYAVDIDGDMDPAKSATTLNSGYDQRTVYRQISPDGPIFQSSPILIANATGPIYTPPATAGGNGGIVLVVAGDTLYDFSATPISNPITTQAFPLIREDKAYVGFGPLSSPAVAATTVYDVAKPGISLPFTVPPTVNVVTDWIYVGDSSTGLCRGITPNDPTDGNIPSDLGDIIPPTPNPPTVVDLSAILRTYLVDDAHAGSVNYADRLPVTGSLPVYEWGQNVYIRIANVVPPNSTNDPLKYVHDGALTAAQLAAASPTSPITFYTNPTDLVNVSSNSVTYTLSDSTPTGNADIGPVSVDSGSIPAATPPVPASVLTPLINGFYVRSTTDATADKVGENNLVDGSGNKWIAAATYFIGDGTARKNTPGARRRVQEATQAVRVKIFYNTSGDGNPANAANFVPPAAVPPAVTEGSTAVLRATASNGNEVSVLQADGTYKFQVVQPSEQPTFGILNPIGVRGGGIPLPLLNGTASGAAVEIGNELGPFRGATSPPTTVGGLGDKYALEALTNGNGVYVFAPPSGSGTGNPTLLPLVGSANNPNVVTQTVVTSTGLIPNNSGGDNLDNVVGIAPPSGVYAGTGTPGLLTTNFGSPDRPFSMDVFDRGALGIATNSTGTTAAPRSLKLKAGGASDTGGTANAGGVGMSWNDNTQGLSTGHDAVVNYLPWETPPATYVSGNVNTSPDYPDIAPQHVALTLHADDNNGGSTASLNSDGAVATPANGSGAGVDALHRTVYASPVQVHVDVPRYQPANQQLYSKTLGGANGYSSAGEIVPQQIGTSGDQVFPMGYITTQRIYVPNASGRYQPGCAYRDVRIYTGVPVSMSTSIANGTIDIGKVPSSFGIQTGQYTGLGPFAPYNANFYNYFLPVTIHNDGNVNLLNVHLDQKVNTASGTLLLQSDPVDTLSDIPAYDVTGVTGPRTGSFAGVAELPFLVRSSVDTDLAAAYGRNPGIVADATLKFEYLGTTFHKALPGSGAPTTLRVPDAPENTSDPVFGVLPTTDPNGKPQVNRQALPHVSVAIPFGTPVGAYRQTVRVFEGLDTTGYTTYSGTGQAPNPYYPPQYGSAIGGRQAPATAPTDVLSVGLQPMSDPGVTVRATVLEDRLTDGFTVGGLPQIDLGAAGTAGKPTPDFAPAAYRDPASGGLGIYWVSGRPVTGSTAPFSIQGAYVPFNMGSGALPGNYFLPSDPTQKWWKPVDVTALPFLNTASPTSTNSGLTIAQDVTDPNNVFAFAVNVVTPPYANNVYSYTVEPGTGKLTSLTGQPVSRDPTQVKYGVHGLYTKSGFAGTVPNLWAFWTSATRGRTAISYNSYTPTKSWSTLPSDTPTIGLLPVPAGLSSVADPSPVLMTAPVIAAGGEITTTAPLTQSVIEVTFSGVAPDGNTDLYQCRYAPDTTNATTVSKLNLFSYPKVTETLLSADGGWYQARDVAWSRTGALNLTLTNTATGAATPILYDAALKPLFTRAVFDKASGLLVLTGVTFSGAAGGPVTVYADLATGRVKFSTALPDATTVSATFNPLARRLTLDNRADTAPVTFLDGFQKPNDTASFTASVPADRRWYVWRKSGVTGDAHSATIYYKTQRLTLFLPTPITSNLSITVANGASTTLVDVDAARGRLYFPITDDGTPTGKSLEGQSVKVTYTYVPPSTITATNPTGTPQSEAPPADTIEWQDEQRANDTSNSPTTTTGGLAAVYDYAVPLDTPVNENNVSAFLDPFAGASFEHKVWLFWNSTRNGTADLYYETINPRF